MSIQTAQDKNNFFFKEQLKRILKPHYDKPHKFILNASIKFVKKSTLSNSGLSSLTKITGIVTYSLHNSETNQLIKSDSIKSFPVIGDTSSSMYSQDTNVKFIKERLTINLSQRLSTRIKVLLRKMS